jgi:hypothetical protein
MFQLGGFGMQRLPDKNRMSPASAIYRACGASWCCPCNFGLVLHRAYWTATESYSSAVCLLTATMTFTYSRCNCELPPHSAPNKGSETAYYLLLLLHGIALSLFFWGVCYLLTTDDATAARISHPRAIGGSVVWYLLWYVVVLTW